MRLRGQVFIDESRVVRCREKPMKSPTLLVATIALTVLRGDRCQRLTNHHYAGAGLVPERTAAARAYETTSSNVFDS